MKLSEADERALSDAIRSLRIGWQHFADAIAEGDEASAEGWASFTFQLWEALDPVDESAGPWNARRVFLGLS